MMRSTGQDLAEAREGSSGGHSLVISGARQLIPAGPSRARVRVGHGLPRLANRLDAYPEAVGFLREVLAG